MLRDMETSASSCLAHSNCPGTWADYQPSVALNRAESTHLWKHNFIKPECDSLTFSSLQGPSLITIDT